MPFAFSAVGALPLSVAASTTDDRIFFAANGAAVSITAMVGLVEVGAFLTVSDSAVVDVLATFVGDTTAHKPPPPERFQKTMIAQGTNPAAGATDRLRQIPPRDA